MNDKLKIIAEYAESNNVGYDMIGDTYLTSLDALHPVAMKVLGELRNVYTLIGASKHLVAISVACTQPPINGEYSDLFNDTVEGIIYLQNQEK